MNYQLYLMNRFGLRKILFLIIAFCFQLTFYGQASTYNQLKRIIQLADTNTTIAKDSLQLIEHLIRRTGTPYHKGLFSEAHGCILEKEEKYKLALEKYLIALSHYQKTDSLRAISSIYNDIGVIYYWLSEYENSISAYHKSIAIAEKLKNQKLLSKAYQNTGMLYSRMDRKLSLKYYHKALEIIRNNPSERSNKAGLLQNIGVEYSKSGKLLEAIQYYKQSLEIYQELNETVSLAITYNNLGVLYERMNKSDTTLLYYQKALDIFYDIDFKRGITTSLYNIGSIYRQKGQYSEALEYVNKSQEIARELGLKDQIQVNFYELSWIYELEKDYKTSLENMVLAYNWKDTLFTIEQAKQISEFEAIYESEKKEKEILELEKKRERGRTYITLLISSIILLIMLIVFLLVFHKLREKASVQKALSKEQNKHFKAVLEAQEEERKRIAGELHDSVGPLLSVTQLYISDLADVSGNKTSEEEELFSKSLKILEEACNETRNISHNLMPGVLIRSGLISAIRELINKVNKTARFKIYFDSNGLKNRFEENIEIANYRIFQELLNNIIRHANASEIMVNLDANKNQLHLNIKDNGKGFDVEKIKSTPGIGWKSIYSRLSLINGRAEITSDKSGTQVKISSPIH